MNAVMEYRSLDAVVYSSIRHEDSGDIVEEILNRLGRVETDVSALKFDVSDLKSDVRDILTKMADLATKIELSDLRGEFKELKGEFKAGLASLETKMMRWYFATALTTGGLAFTLAKYLH